MSHEPVSRSMAKKRIDPSQAQSRVAIDAVGDVVDAGTPSADTTSAGTTTGKHTPVSHTDNVQIKPTAFDPWQLTQQFQTSKLATGEFGATASFVGTMRDFNENDDVKAMTLEHYPGMTESQLQAIINDAQQQWPLLESLIVHRVGDIAPGDPIVLVVCWSAHRAAAFDACRYLMEALKSRAPFWKKETLADNSQRWVEKNTDGHAPAQK